VEHPVRACILAQAGRTARISRGRETAGEDEGERGEVSREKERERERERGCEGAAERATKRKSAAGQRLPPLLYGEERGGRGGKGGEEAEMAENERVIRLIFQHREILPLNH